MISTFTCIICPVGCTIEAETKQNVIVRLEGNSCPKGLAYVKQELTNPTRNIATSVLVKGGELPLCSVRLTKPIPKGKIFDVLGEINKQTLIAPVSAGEVVIADVLGLGADVITTKKIQKAESGNLLIKQR